MTDQEYFGHIAAALSAVIDGCARYMAKNPNAKYKDPDGREQSIGVAIDVARKHMKTLQEITDGEEKV